MSYRKLVYHQILDVSMHGRQRWEGGRGRGRGPSYIPTSYYLREFSAAASVLDESGRHTAPGTYAVMPAGLILPKKRRGERFVVRYTEAREKEF